MSELAYINKVLPDFYNVAKQNLMERTNDYSDYNKNFYTPAQSHSQDTYLKQQSAYSLTNHVTHFYSRLIWAQIIVFLFNLLYFKDHEMAENKSNPPASSNQPTYEMPVAIQKKSNQSQKNKEQKQPSLRTGKREVQEVLEKGLQQWVEDDSYGDYNSCLASINEESVNERYEEIKQTFPEHFSNQTKHQDEVMIPLAATNQKVEEVSR